MFVMLTMTWPTKSSFELGKVAVKTLATAPPPYVKRLGVYNATGGDGFKSYCLYEIEKGQVQEGLIEVTKRMVPYYSVEGFKYTIEPLMTPEEALPTIGL